MAAPALIAGALWTALVVGVSLSPPATRVILLPSDDGTPTAVLVSTPGGAQTVGKPYERATAPNDSQAAPSVDQADPAQVRAENKELFELLPAKAREFQLLFDAGGTALTPASMQALDGILADALARPGADITVTGHTDTRGPAADNDALSMRRAEQIRQLLSDRGFPAHRIEAIGRGERELAVSTADNVDEPRNRRVVVVVR